MTIQEMHNGIAIELDKSGSLTYPSFLPSEIDYWLNAAQLKKVKDTLFGSRSNPTNATNSTSNIEDLRTLLTVVSYQPLNAIAGYENFGSVDINSNLLHLNEAIFKVNSSGDEFRTSRINPMDKLNYLSSPNNKPWIENPLSFIENDKLTLVIDPVEYNTGVVSMSNYSALYSYYKIPSDVDLGTSTDSELPDSLHQEIVELAANMMLENIESPRFPNNTQLINDTL